MKRIGNISVSCLLSLMIIWMSVGIVMQHCLHTGAIRAAQTSVSESQKKCAMPAKGKCMQLQVHKLSPADVSQSSPIVLDVWALPVAFCKPFAFCRIAIQQ